MKRLIKLKKNYKETNDSQNYVEFSLTFWKKRRQWSKNVYQSVKKYIFNFFCVTKLLQILQSMKKNNERHVKDVDSGSCCLTNRSTYVIYESLCSMFHCTSPVNAESKAAMQAKFGQNAWNVDMSWVNWAFSFLIKVTMETNISLVKKIESKRFHHCLQLVNASVVAFDWFLTVSTPGWNLETER